MPGWRATCAAGMQNRFLLFYVTFRPEEVEVKALRAVVTALQTEKSRPSTAMGFAQDHRGKLSVI